MLRHYERSQSILQNYCVWTLSGHFPCKHNNQSPLHLHNDVRSRMYRNISITKICFIPKHIIIDVQSHVFSPSFSSPSSYPRSLSFTSLISPVSSSLQTDSIPLLSFPLSNDRCSLSLDSMIVLPL